MWMRLVNFFGEMEEDTRKMTKEEKGRNVQKQIKQE